MNGGGGSAAAAAAATPSNETSNGEGDGGEDTSDLGSSEFNKKGFGDANEVLRESKTGLYWRNYEDLSKMQFKFKAPSAKFQFYGFEMTYNGRRVSEISTPVMLLGTGSQMDLFGNYEPLLKYPSKEQKYACTEPSKTKRKYQMTTRAWNLDNISPADPNADAEALAFRDWMVRLEKRYIKAASEEQKVISRLTSQWRAFVQEQKGYNNIPPAGVSEYDFYIEPFFLRKFKSVFSKKEDTDTGVQYPIKSEFMYTQESNISLYQKDWAPLPEKPAKDGSNAKKLGVLNPTTYALVASVANQDYFWKDTTKIYIAGSKDVSTPVPFWNQFHADGSSRFKTAVVSQVIKFAPDYNDMTAARPNRLSLTVTEMRIYANGFKMARPVETVTDTTAQKEDEIFAISDALHAEDAAETETRLVGVLNASRTDQSMLAFKPSTTWSADYVKTIANEMAKNKKEMGDKVKALA
jgi:hypothetical protein